MMVCKKGDAVLMDTRVFHCAGENVHKTMPRCLFHFTMAGAPAGGGCKANKGGGNMSNPKGFTYNMSEEMRRRDLRLRDMKAA